MNTCPFCYTEGCPLQEARELGIKTTGGLLKYSVSEYAALAQVCALNRIATNLVSIRAILTHSEDPITRYPGPRPRWSPGIGREG